ncbi:MAG: 30S ribosomal protein S9 [Deltaproteobacteria bacterium]|nr:30S ribosomal protein S9 [Deltaproteobacteria bacterium]
MAQPVKVERYYATGKRKSAIARVYVYPNGNGTFQINQNNYEAYFPELSKRKVIEQPLELSKLSGKMDVYVNVNGGGLNGQTQAIRHGISKALTLYQPELRKILKAHGLLTRDSRRVERKKAGQRGARARYQYSKR